MYKRQVEWLSGTDEDQGGWRKFCGRGQAPRIQRVPYQVRVSGLDRSQPVHLKFNAMLNVLHLLAAERIELAQAQLSLRAVLAGLPLALLEADTPEDDEAVMGMLEDPLRWMPWAEEVSRKADRYDERIAQDEWRDWVHKALTQGASLAHKYTKGPGAVAVTTCGVNLAEHMEERTKVWEDLLSLIHI